MTSPVPLHRCADRPGGVDVCAGCDEPWPCQAFRDAVEIVLGAAGYELEPDDGFGLPHEFEQQTTYPHKLDRCRCSRPQAHPLHGEGNPA